MVVVEALMMMIILTISMVADVRESRGLILLMAHGLYIQMLDVDGELKY